MILQSDGVYTSHFRGSEFKCKCCDKIFIDSRLIEILERLYTRVNAKYLIINSGYRCPSYDKQIGGFIGKHAEGLAVDIHILKSDGKRLDSATICCKLQDIFTELNYKSYGIAKINDTSVHVDVRRSGIYKGDETKSNNTVTDDFYKYFNIMR